MPGKNLLPLDGRPLIAYSVLVARSIPEIDRVVVVSDGTEILAAGRAWGADLCTLPDALTGDDATLLGSLQWVIKAVEAPPDPMRAGWIVLLQPNCPLRLVDQCRGWIQEVAVQPEVDGLLTVDSEPYKLGSTTPLGYYRPEYTPGIIKQQVQPRLRENGLFYMLKADNIRLGDLFGPKMLPRQCAREQSLANIDYQWDFEFTTWAYEHFGYSTEFDSMEVSLGQHP